MDFSKLISFDNNTSINEKIAEFGANKGIDITVYKKSEDYETVEGVVCDENLIKVLDLLGAKIEPEIDTITISKEIENLSVGGYITANDKIYKIDIFADMLNKAINICVDFNDIEDMEDLIEEIDSLLIDEISKEGLTKATLLRAIENGFSLDNICGTCLRQWFDCPYGDKSKMKANGTEEADDVLMEGKSYCTSYVGPVDGTLKGTIRDLARQY